MNPELLAINQDEAGGQPQLVNKQNGIWVYKKILQDGSCAVAVFNTNAKQRPYDLSASLLQLDGSFNVRDVWKRSDMGLLNKSLSLTLQGHETIVLRISKTK
jgi:alpha-galactosidase